MYNTEIKSYTNYIKLTEQHQRDATRTMYVNLDRVDRMVEMPKGTRLYFGKDMIDVLEDIDHILGNESALVITDKEDENVGRRNEDGRVSNPAK